MRLEILSAVLATTQLGLSHRVNPRAGRGWCGTPEPGASFMNSMTSLHYMEADVRAGILKPRQDEDKPQTIPILIHTVSSTKKQGLISDARVDLQIKVMKASYKPYGFTFLELGRNHFVDDDLATGPFSRADAFETFLKESRNGSYATLNLYFYTDYPDQQFGLCTLPEAGLANARAEDVFDDGCHINAGTIPGGDIEEYNLGYTVVHEVGHWLGLLHTFNGYSCTGKGDLIDDTPPQREDTSGCPTRKDSCPDQEGDDAIHNYMDYSSDPCYREFTHGQQVRMHNSWFLYRATGGTAIDNLD